MGPERGNPRAGGDVQGVAGLGHMGVGGPGRGRGMQGSQTRACEWEGKEPPAGAGPGHRGCATEVGTASSRRGQGGAGLGLPGSVGMVRQEWRGSGCKR